MSLRQDCVGSQGGRGEIRKPSFCPSLWETLYKWDEDRLQKQPRNTGDKEWYDNKREACGLDCSDITP